MKESEIEYYLVRQVQKMGGYALKLAPTVAGLPDRLVLLPDGGIMFAELKSDDGEARPLQLVWQRRLRKLGFVSEILNSKESVRRFLETGRSDG